MQPPLLALSLVSFLAGLPCAPAQTAAASGTLGSTFYDWGTLVQAPTPSGSRCEVVDSPTLTFDRLSIHITTLRAGLAVHPPQSHSQEEVVLIKEGTLEISLNGQKLRAGPGELLFLAARAVHNLTNVGDGPASYYVIDVYTGASATVPNRPESDWLPAGKLHSTLFDCDNIPAKPNPNGSRRSVVDSPTFTFAEFESHLTTLAPGKSTPVLTDPADEIIVIKSGLVEVSIKSVSCRMGPGSFYFQASNDVHKVTNLGATPATYQVIKFVTEKTPKPPA